MYTMRGWACRVFVWHRDPASVTHQQNHALSQPHITKLQTSLPASRTPTGNFCTVEPGKQAGWLAHTCPATSGFRICVLLVAGVALIPVRAECTHTAPSRPLGWHPSPCLTPLPRPTHVAPPLCVTRGLIGRPRWSEGVASMPETAKSKGNISKPGGERGAMGFPGGSQVSSRSAQREEASAPPAPWPDPSRAHPGVCSWVRAKGHFEAPRIV